MDLLVFFYALGKVCHRDLTILNDFHGQTFYLKSVALFQLLSPRGVKLCTQSCVTSEFACHWPPSTERGIAVEVVRQDLFFPSSLSTQSGSEDSLFNWMHSLCCYFDVLMHCAKVPALILFMHVTW